MEEQVGPWNDGGSTQPMVKLGQPSTGDKGMTKRDNVIDVLRDGLAQLNEAIRYADPSPAIDAHATVTKEGLQLVATAISELARSNDRIADAVDRVADEVNRAGLYL